MTMKRQKTVHRFAAVAAVLLTFCLVFMMPVGATEETTWVEVSTFDDLENALDNQKAVIYITAPITVTGQLNIDYSVIINGNNHLLTGASTVRKLFTINDVTPSSEEITVVFNQVHLTSDRPSSYDSNTRLIDTRGGNIKLTLNDCVLKYNENVAGTWFQPLTIGGYTNDKATITIENTQIDAGLKGYGIIVFNPVQMTIKDSPVISGYAALYFKNNTKEDGTVYGAKGSKVSIVNSVLSTENTLTGASNSFGTINFEDDCITVDIDATSQIIATRNAPEDYTSDDVYQSAFNFSYNTYEVSTLKSDNPTPVSNIAVTVNGKVTLTDVKGGSNAILLSDNDGVNTLKFENGAKANTEDVSNYIDENKQFVESPDAYGYCKVVGKTWEIGSNKETLTFTGNAGSVISPQEVTITNTGNQPIKLTSTSVDSEDFTVSPSGDIDINLNPKETATITVTPAAQAEAKEYKGVLTISTNTAVTKKVELSFTASSPEKIEPPVFSGLDKTDDNKITIDSTTYEADEVEVDGVGCVGIISTVNPSVVLMFPGASLENGEVNLGEESTVLATYVPVASEVADSETPATFTAIIVMEDHTVALPTLSGKFDEDVAGAVTEAYKDYKPLSMLSTTTDVEAINSHLEEVEGSVIISFTISNELYQKYNGKFIVLHVKGGKVVGTIQVTPEKNTDGTWDIPAVGSSFSSYVLSVDNTPKSVGSGSATDTGSGNYQYYPRSVPTDGIVDFGTSKVVTGMELPAGSDGTVTLNIKPTFTMPENGFYAFEIDAPGYNLDAKINGGLSFQIPVADLEAAGFTANDIVLFHGTVGEDGKITWEALPTNLVKNENGVAYYKAAINSCSPFYIGFVKDGSVVNTEVVDPVTPETPETPVTPDEPEVLPPVDEPETPEQPTESPAPILAVLAGLGAAVVLRRK